jgi:hypothetical protein
MTLCLSLCLSLDHPSLSWSLSLLISQINTPSVTTTVRKSDEVILDVLPGQLVIWKFYLENYDIGFQVEVDGEVKV